MANTVRITSGDEDPRPVEQGGTFRSGGNFNLDDLGGGRVGANDPGDGTSATGVLPFGLIPSFGNPEVGVKSWQS